MSASGRMRAFKLVVAYDGAEFAGWQRQADARTVQATIEEALLPLAGELVTVTGAGRTDAGVHAAGQVVSVSFDSMRPTHELQRALNATLPADVRVLAMDEVDPSFDARRHARIKTYRYAVWNGPSIPPHARRLVWHVLTRLDIDAMNEGARRLLGEHDFSAFQSTGSSVQTTTRELVLSQWTEVDWRVDPLGTIASPSLSPDSRLLRYEVTGNGFLRHMVRTMVGTLVDVGRGRLAPEDITRILESHDRSTAGQTAPPHGLMLWHVEY